MNGKSETTISKHIRSIHVEGLKPASDGTPAVSQTQCINTDPNSVNIDFVTIGASNSELGINPNQSECMKELVNETVGTKTVGKISHVSSS